MIERDRLSDFRLSRATNMLAALLRIVVGLVVLGLSYSTYKSTFSAMESGGKLQVFGVETGASSGQLTAGFVVVGLIGVFILIKGVMELLRSRQDA